MTAHKSSSRNSAENLVLLLRKTGCDESVISHSLAVSALAVEFAEKIKKNGYEINVDFVQKAALLHDIGRARTHGISHGVLGAEILSRYSFPETYSQVCGCHIGAGITKEETEKLGLPKKDYLPKTLEEKVIANADNLIFGEKRVKIGETIKKIEKKLGKNHPAILRLSSLSSEIEVFISKSKLR